MNEIVMWQFQVIPWRPDLNVKSMENIIKETPASKLIVFPEMAISWYMLWDKEWLSESFVKECRSYNERILKILWETWNSAIWWNVDFDETKKNQDWSMRKYNTAFVAEKWIMLWKRYKTLLPNYRMFDDKRYFTSLQDLALEEWISLEEYYKPFLIEINWVKRKVWVLICEDMWNINGDYNVDPVELSKRHWIDLLAISSCSPFWLNKDVFRKKLLEKHSSDSTEIVYVNPIWVQNNWKNTLVFDWWSAIYKWWKMIQRVVDFTQMQTSDLLETKSEYKQIFDSLIFAIKEKYKQIWAKKIVIWLSWWIDSAVVAALCVIALWKENVLAINMPSKFNSNTTKWLAQSLASNLGIDYKIFPIQDIVDQKVKSMGIFTWITPSSFDIENIQARERWQILSDISAVVGWIFTCNWNKDEFMMWYGTLYWDIAWALAIIWDLHKFQVFELAKYINQISNTELIPNDLINLKPAAELSDAQNPENWWWDPFDYEYLWRLNKLIIEKKVRPADILKLYLDWKLEQTIWLKKSILEIYKTPADFISDLERFWKLLHINYFKRVQSPSIITINKASLWFDYRESELSVFFGQEYEKLKEEILAK